MYYEIIFINNPTPDSDGEFEVFNFSSEAIFIDHFLYPPCSFFTYSIEQVTDTGWVKLYYNESQGNWTNTIFNPDSVYMICDVIMQPFELRPLKSFKQKITGLDQVGEYRLTIRYSLDGKSETYTLMADYKVTY